MKHPLSYFVGLAVMAGTCLNLGAETKVPSIFGDHMVLQRDMKVSVWGWDNAGQDVTVKFAGQEVSGKTGDDGRWEVELEPLKTSAKGQKMSVMGSSNLELNDILVGEVWLCSGQSNMQWSVSQSDDPDLEALMADYPQIRLITVPRIGTQEPQYDFEGAWEKCSPETVNEFSAVGYYFGKTLHEVFDVPIGLIDNAWGGSAAEAWVRRDLLEADSAYKPYLDEWVKTETTYDHDKAVAAYEVKLAEWQEKAKAAREAGKAQPPRPRAPQNRLVGQHRPANLYNGVLKPVIGYGIRGTIWYQGESNAGRAYNYRELFPLMITSWREEWGQGDFPFYWVQLADFREETEEPQLVSAWAELQEAQTMSLKLPNTGQAVINDLGEATDIHPKDKQNVAKRLARHALAKDYGIDIVHESPRYAGHEVKDNKIVVTFEHVGGGLDTFDVREAIGFAIAGEDQQFVWADAKVIGSDKVEVWADGVDAPKAVRYAFADNPVANLQNKEGLPATPFRTDDWHTSTRPE